jgi:hypothetical protein
MVDAIFAKYPIETTSIGKKAPLKIQSTFARKYRTRLREEWAEAKTPNLADHYYAFEHIGCGTGCVVIAVADWNTGEVFDTGLADVFATRRTSDAIVISAYGTCEYAGFHSAYRFQRGQVTKVVDDYCATP